MRPFARIADSVNLRRVKRAFRTLVVPYPARVICKMNLNAGPDRLGEICGKHLFIRERAMRRSGRIDYERPQSRELQFDAHTPAESKHVAAKRGKGKRTPK